MPDRYPGYATPQGTQRYQERSETSCGVTRGHFRTALDGLSLSSLGMGSYLGEPDQATSSLMTDAVIRSVTSGAINIIDTAINYRFQASERSIGEGLSRLMDTQGILRDELLICSKNGYLTPDASVQKPFPQYFQENYLQTGIVDLQDVAGGMHCMSPRFLADQLERSLSNLHLETLDVMYLHNAAESQLGEVGEAAFFDRLAKAFEFYESARRDGKIRYYGLATWDCFRVPPEQTGRYLSLDQVLQLAEQVGGKQTHGLRFIQAPFNLVMPEVLTMVNQTWQGQPKTTLAVCQAAGLAFLASVPLLQGRLLEEMDLPDFEGAASPAQKCLQFVRSAPGVLAPLVGHKDPVHVEDNLHIAKTPPISQEEFQGLFEEPVSSLS